MTIVSTVFAPLHEIMYTTLTIVLSVPLLREPSLVAAVNRLQTSVLQISQELEEMKRSGQEVRRRQPRRRRYRPPHQQQQQQQQQQRSFGPTRAGDSPGLTTSRERSDGHDETRRNPRGRRPNPYPVRERESRGEKRKEERKEEKGGGRGPGRGQGGKGRGEGKGG